MKYSNIFKKYLQNRASPEEVKLLRTWLNQSEGDDENLLNFIEEEWQEFISTDGDSLPEMNRILLKINDTIDRKEGVNRKKTRRRMIQRIRTYQMFSAAAAVILLTCVFYFVIRKKSETPVSDQPVTEIKSNPKGQKSTIVLLDGTRVKLNSDSELSSPETFASDKRIVHLKGEAFFEVAKDASRPFTVVTDNVTTTALGTSFNVRAFENHENIEITLATGVVRVADLKNKNDHLILRPNHRATFSRSTSQFVRDSLNITAMLSWKDGVLIFKDAAFPELKEKIERWYNVHLTLNHGERWGDRSITGKFENETLENVLNGVSYSSRFTYRINGREVTIDL